VDIVEWLLDTDPAIRWQVIRDLTDAPDDVVAAERGRVATEGWGARLLALQGPDGQWGGGTYFPAWTATAWTLMLLRDLGLDPKSAGARRKRDADGRWPLENPHPGEVHLDMDEGEGRPSRWNTLRATRVLRWYHQAERSASSGSGSGAVV
jgi:hypothetical protein